jgi:hypothetical protein
MAVRTNHAGALKPCSMAFNAGCAFMSTSKRKGSIIMIECIVSTSSWVTAQARNVCVSVPIYAGVGVISFGIFMTTYAGE